MPEALRSTDPTLQNCLTLLRAVWQTQHAQIYQILRQLPWPEVLQPLVRRYESKCSVTMGIVVHCSCLSGFFQDQTLIAISTSYEAIRPAVAASYLGLDPQAAEDGNPEIIQKFTICGWAWNPETQLLRPVPITVKPTNGQASKGIRDAMAMLGSRGG